MKKKKETVKKKVIKKKVIKKKITKKKKQITKLGDASIEKTENVIVDENFLSTIGEEPVVKQKDARILREALSWCCKHLPIEAQKKTHNALRDYAISVGKYCKCFDRSFVRKEKKFACLDCGRRHESAK